LTLPVAGRPTPNPLLEEREQVTSSVEVITS